jgi:two-component system sensor histidine kinase TctE
MLLTFLLGLCGAMIYYYIEAYAVGEHLEERTLQSQARELMAVLTISPDESAKVALPARLTSLYAGPNSTSFYSLYGRSGQPILRSGNLAADLPLIEPPASRRYGSMSFIQTEAGQTAILPALIDGGHVLIVGRSHPNEDALAFTLIEEGLEGLFIVLVPFVLISLLIIWLITEWSLRPVARATEQARLIGPGNLSARIDTELLAQEIHPLADAANGALERLAKAYAVERRLTADAAHELRTPLAVLNLRLQQAKIKGAIDWPVLEREVATLNKLVNQLLDLARKESAEHDPDVAAMPLVNLSRIVREAAAAVLPLADQAERVIDIEEPSNARIRGRPDDLRDMVRNLIENALSHGSGVIRIGLRPVDMPAHGFVIDVDDEGVAALSDELFTRFRKGNASSSGTGLGLAIVRQVARNHGGDASFMTEEGKTRVRVFLPTRSRDRDAFSS